jgi:peroxiredoxin
MAMQQTATLLGTKATDFRLPGTDGRVYSLADVSQRNGVVVAFICNHCPYVKAVVDRMVEDARTLMAEGIGFVAICANDAEAYPEDSPPNMKLFSAKHAFPFPYLFDETQKIARAYDAVCTPEFYGITREGVIAYHGRVDEGRKDAPPAGAKRELVDAMRLMASTGRGPDRQIPSVGCSIKWKGAA